MYAYTLNNLVNKKDKTGTRAVLATSILDEGGGNHANIEYMKAFYGVRDSDKIPELPEGAKIFVENITSYTVVDPLVIVRGKTIVMDADKYCEYTFFGAGLSLSKSMRFDQTITQGYVYGVNDIDDYCGFFAGGSFNMLSSAVGGADAPSVHAEIINGIGYAPSISMSLTWYSATQSDWIYGPANMRIIINPYEGTLIN